MATHPYLARFSGETWRRITATVAGVRGRPLYSDQAPTIREFIEEACVRECERVEMEENKGKRFRRVRRTPTGRPRKLTGVTNGGDAADRSRDRDQSSAE